MIYSGVKNRVTRARVFPWRIFWYFAPTGLNGLVAVGSIPILILAIGESHWAQLALGQSVGLVGSVVVSLGWPVTGPAEIARASPERRYGILIRSLTVRLLLTVPVIMCIVGTAAILPGAWNLLFICTSSATALLGLASSWFYLGVDKPVALFLIDALTRGLGVVGGLVLALSYEEGLFFAAGLILGLLLSVVFTTLYARKAHFRVKEHYGFRSIIAAIKLQRQGVGFNIVYVVLCSIALPLTSFVGAHAFVVFAVIDKVQKQLVTVMLPILQIVVSRMSKNISAGVDVRVSARKSLRNIYLAGFIFFCFSLFLGPIIVDLLSVGTVRMDFLTGVAFAVLVALAFMTQTIPVAVLAPLNRLGYAILGSVVGICVMVPSILLLGEGFSILGILLSVDCAYGVCLAFLLVAARRAQERL